MHEAANDPKRTARWTLHNEGSSLRYPDYEVVFHWRAFSEHEPRYDVNSNKYQPLIVSKGGGACGCDHSLLNVSQHVLNGGTYLSVRALGAPATRGHVTNARYGIGG